MLAFSLSSDQLRRTSEISNQPPTRYRLKYVDRQYEELVFAEFRDFNRIKDFIVRDKSLQNKAKLRHIIRTLTQEAQHASSQGHPTIVDTCIQQVVLLDDLSGRQTDSRTHVKNGALVVRLCGKDRAALDLFHKRFAQLNASIRRDIAQPAKSTATDRPEILDRHQISYIHRAPDPEQALDFQQTSYSHLALDPEQALDFQQAPNRHQPSYSHLALDPEQVLDFQQAPNRHQTLYSHRAPNPQQASDRHQTSYSHRAQEPRQVSDRHQTLDRRQTSDRHQTSYSHRAPDRHEIPDRHESNLRDNRKVSARPIASYNRDTSTHRGSILFPPIPGETSATSAESLRPGAPVSPSSATRPIVLKTLSHPASLLTESDTGVSKGAAIDMESDISEIHPLAQDHLSRNDGTAVAGDGLLETEIVITKEFEIEFDVYTALEEFVELSRSRSYNDANKYFEEVLDPYISHFPVFAEYALNLIRQDKHDTLSETLKSWRINNVVQKEEREFIAFLRLYVDLMRGAQAQEVLEKLRQSYALLPDSAAAQNEVTVSSSSPTFRVNLLLAYPGTMSDIVFENDLAHCALVEVYHSLRHPTALGSWLYRRDLDRLPRLEP